MDPSISAISLSIHTSSIYPTYGYMLCSWLFILLLLRSLYYFNLALLDTINLYGIHLTRFHSISWLDGDSSVWYKINHMYVLTYIGMYFQNLMKLHIISLTYNYTTCEKQRPNFLCIVERVSKPLSL